MGLTCAGTRQARFIDRHKGAARPIDNRPQDAILPHKAVTGKTDLFALYFYVFSFNNLLNGLAGVLHVN